MRRREFLVLVGGAAAWPLATRAKPAKLPIIGFLGPLPQATMTSWTAAFVQRLHDLGWSEGRTIAIEYRWAEGHSERLGDLVAEFVRLKVAVIVTAGTTAVLTAKRVTSVTPIVFGAAGDPVRLGLVDSLGRPGGNVTGLSNQSAICRANASICCVRWFPAFAGLRYLPMSARASECWSGMNLKLPPER
jgi:putative ABC transport system substrate-binding protein